MDSPVADDLLAAANRERAEGEPQPAFAEGVGLLSTADDPAGLEPAAVSFALGSDGDAGIAALAALAEGEQAGELLERDRDVTVEDALIDDAEAVVDVLAEDDEGNPGLRLGAAMAGTDPLRDKLVLAPAGTHVVVEAAQRPVDWVMASIVGSAGLRSAWAAAAESSDRRRAARSISLEIV